MLTAEELSMSKLAMRRTCEHDPTALQEDAQALYATIDDIYPGPEGAKFKTAMKQIEGAVNTFEDLLDAGIRAQMKKEQTAEAAQSGAQAHVKERDEKGVKENSTERGEAYKKSKCCI